MTCVEVYRVDVSSRRGDYGVHIGMGIAASMLKELRLRYLKNKFIVITDENLDVLYQNEWQNYFESEKNIYKYVVPAGEKAKSFGIMVEILESMAEWGFNRSDVVIAFGGGIVGDLAGYVASSYMRGVTFVQIPTTLLSMVDSSVGGKVAVNLSHGKNLAGAFYSPDLVICDLNFLKTLSRREFVSGMCEVIKYGMIWDEAILDECGVIGSALSQSPSSDDQMGPRIDVLSGLLRLVTSCIQAKADVVSKDELEQDLRMILNYGHTFGHAIESAYGYTKFNHGEAVGLGMLLVETFYASVMISNQGKKCVKELIMRYRRLKGLLTDLGLPTSVEQLPLIEMLPYVLMDKKSEESGIKMIFIDSIGKAKISTVSTSELESFMCKRDISDRSCFGEII